MPTITPFLTFVDQAEAAAKLYISIVGGRILSATPMTVEVELAGQRFVFLNGGDHFRFTEAFSLSVECDTQQEIDAYTEKLLAGGGKQGPCGWLTDRFGVSWQVTPRILPKLLFDKDPAKARRAMEAMRSMQKLDIAALERAHAGA
jgi:predicted 3-demethylubiquinone-9 3-methyltransferase (glyoxalase superfamily)